MEMKIKDFIYKYSIRLFILIVAYLIVSFPFQYTQEKMNDVSQENPFKATDLQFGIRPLTVTKVYETKDSIFIVGNNFTNFCQVFNGDVKINTTYHNEHLLEVSKKDLKDGDTFKVSIVSKAPRVLSSSNEYVYQEKSEK